MRVRDAFGWIGRAEPTLGVTVELAPFDLCHLADRPEFIDLLAPLLIRQWDEPTTPEQVAARSQRLMAHCNRDRLPLALVAYDGHGPIGLVALRTRDLDARPDLGPWLGGLYVKPERRKNGIGAALCEAAQFEARSLGIDTLYAFTLDRVAFYERLGFGSYSPALWQGRSGVILRKEL